MNYDLKIALIGNPNCGKTTLFNAYTGANLKTANWPGVTVEKKEGHFVFEQKDIFVTDLPGTYSLSSYTLEERLSRKYIIDGEADVIIDVIDASALERNLYLALQLIELKKPLVIALNMMDIVEERGMKIDILKLSEMLGVKVVPVCARKRNNLEKLMDAAFEVFESRKENYKERSVKNESDRFPFIYSDDIEFKISEVEKRFALKYPYTVNYRWYAIKFLEQDEEVKKEYIITLDDIVDKNYEDEIIKQKYDFAENISDRVIINKTEKNILTDKIDLLVTNEFLSIPIFFCIMAFIFFLTFFAGDYLKGYIEEAITVFSDFLLTLLQRINCGRFVCSLVIDGVVAGVGGIITFLPNIFILFIGLAFLEDSGYMARAAYAMDGIMSRIGLSGRAFIPMLLGFGCTVPAVMASRTLENSRDRLKTILITPFMSCSARLPIYLIISEVFFGKYAVFASISMYMAGILAAVIVALILNKFKVFKEHSDLLIELPEYKIPNLRTVFIYAWEKVKDYFTKAGTTIFIASVILWFLLNFNAGGFSGSMENSFAATISRLLIPVMTPLGLGSWQIIIALISGIAAKEVVVSSMSILFNISNISSSAGMSKLYMALSEMGFSGINAYSFMLFSLLYIPCAAAIGTIKKETGSFKWVFTAVFLQFATAWCVSFLFYIIAVNIRQTSF